MAYNIPQITGKILSAIFIIIAAIGIILLCNAIWGKPTKATIQSDTFIEGILVLSYYSIISSIIAFGLLRSKRWSIYIYWLLLLGHYILMIPILSDTSFESFNLHLLSNILFIIFILIAPLVIGIYLFKKRKEMFP